MQTLFGHNQSTERTAGKLFTLQTFVINNNANSHSRASFCQSYLVRGEHNPLGWLLVFKFNTTKDVLYPDHELSLTRCSLCLKQKVRILDVAKAPVTDESKRNILLLGHEFHPSMFAVAIELYVNL